MKNHRSTAGHPGAFSARQRWVAAGTLACAPILGLVAPTAGALALEGFEAPALPANTHTYTPTGAAWNFSGTTGRGIQRNGSPFHAASAPEGQQTVFLKGHDAWISKSVFLPAGVHKVSFMAARRAAPSGTNPVQVWVNNRRVGAPIAPASTAFARYSSVSIPITTSGTYTIALSSTQQGDHTTFIDAVSIDSPNPFDSLYAADFQLKPLGRELAPVVAKPLTKATSLSVASYIDPVFGTRVYRATAASDYPGSAYVRHEYSRRQAFNADNSRYLAQSMDGHWLLYNADTFQVLPKSGTAGAFKGMVGDCEPIWHPTDPKKLWYTGRNGSLVWYEKNVETDTDTVLVDFTARLRAIWPAATSVWTGGEGTSSADGRYFAFMATHYNEATQTKTIDGLFTWDRVNDKIIGTYDASKFGGVYPDHISISPSGKYAVPSWAYTPKLGTRAYTLDFSSFRQLNTQSEHSDLALGPAGEDYYVVADQAAEQVRAINMANGNAFNLMPLYPRSGSAYALHISGQAFDKPGWVLVSTYGDSANYGKVLPDSTMEPMYRKLMLVELKPGGKQHAVAHTRAAERYQYLSANEGTAYFGEHQATLSRDGSRLLFATNFNDQGPPSSYMIGLPSWVYVGTTGGGGTTPTPTPGGGPLALVLGQVTHSGYSATFKLSSSVAAQCRWSSQAGSSYGAMYDNLSRSADGLSHSKTTTFATTGSQTAYVRCKADASGEEKELVVRID